MKNLNPFLILLMILPVIAQDTETESQDVLDTEEVYIEKGLVLAVEPGRINFEEMWVRFPNFKSKLERHLSLTISNEFDEKIAYGQLTAPFLAEIGYVIVNDEAIVTKIKVLKQYRYDEDGFIKE